MKWCSCFLCGPAIYFRTGTESNPEYAKVKWHVHGMNGQLLMKVSVLLNSVRDLVLRSGFPTVANFLSLSVDSKHFWAIPL